MKKFLIIWFSVSTYCVLASNNVASIHSELNRKEIELQISQIDALPNNTQKTLKLIYLAEFLIKLGLNDVAEEYTKQAEAIVGKLPKKGKSLVYTEIGQLYTIQNDLTKALDAYYLAEQCALEINDSKQLAICYNNIASIHYYLDHKGLAIDLLKKAVLLNQKDKNEIELARLYGNLAFVYETVNLEKALFYSKKSNKLFIKNKREKQTIYSFVQLFRISDLLSQHATAENYLKEALSLAQTDENVLTDIFIIVGQHEIKHGNSEEAEQMLKKGLTIASKTNNSIALIKIHNLLGNYYKDKETTQAIQHFQQALNLAKIVNDKLQLKIATQSLKECYLILGNYKEAFSALELQMQLDSMVQDSKIEEVILMNDVQKKNQELKLQKVKNQHLSTRNQKQFYGTLILIGSMLLFFGFLFSWYKWKALKKNELILKNEVALQTIHLKKANQIQLLMTKALVHDLKSPLIFLSRVANRIYANPNLLSAEELKEVSIDLKQYSENLIVFIEEFVLWIKVKKSDFSPTTAPVIIENLFEKIRELYNEPVLQNGNRLQIEVEPLIINTDVQLLHIVIRNLIDNANKNTHNGTITVKSVEETENYIIQITDTGSGMSKHKIQSLYALLDMENIDESVEANQSLGYKIIMEFTKLLGCEIQITSEGENRGSSIKLIYKK